MDKVSEIIGFPMKETFVCTIYHHYQYGVTVLYHHKIKPYYYHNKKSAAFKTSNAKFYYLYDKYYGKDSDFKSDEEWQRFVKLLAFK